MKYSSATSDPQPIVVVSIGRHTRLGDALEYALEGLPFETTDANEFTQKRLQNRRLLFAASTDAGGENAQMRALTARLSAGACDLSGCVCAMIADKERGGSVHIDALRLLLAANAAGAEVLSRPLLEADRELRSVSQGGNGKETPFERYRAQARVLTRRLSGARTTSAEWPRMRFDTALEGGAAHDWRSALTRAISAVGGELTDEADAEQTILLCENADGLPDERTLALLCGGGKVRFLIASPSAGGELYAAALVERVCLRGDFALPGKALILFEGLSAVEALANRTELERVKLALVPKK
ncbi:MAG: hypothetical protein GX417_09120 [Clostridiales bacterium]|nr:hypothetical protein [Clostridiales bacterium]